jgi:hypothetical protein
VGQCEADNITTIFGVKALCFGKKYKLAQVKTLFGIPSALQEW